MRERFYNSESKTNISNAIREALSEKGLSMRQLAKNLGMSHPQISHMVNGSNYNINTLLKVLDELDLEITIQPKE